MALATGFALTSVTVARNWVCCVVEPAAFGPIAVGDTCNTSRAGASAT